MIRVIKPGLLTTVQDLGRRGFAHLGLSLGGAADCVSFRIANLLVGNDWNAPALEITLLGPTLEFEVAATVAISGYGHGASASSSPPVPLPMNQAFEVAAGTTLAVGPLLAGARAYLAVRGGLAVPEVMQQLLDFPSGKDRRTCKGARCGQEMHSLSVNEHRGVLEGFRRLLLRVCARSQGRSA